VIVLFHDFVPLVDNGINDYVEDGWGDFVALRDTSFSWEG